jgi:hypothetical protein
MRRRRVALASTLALVALGAAWWLLSDGLTAEERRLVGRWVYRDPATGKPQSLTEFTADRLAVTEFIGGIRFQLHVERWSIRDGELVSDFEPRYYKRAFRPVATYFGWSSAPYSRSPVEIDGDTLTMIQPDGTRAILTRDP